VKKLRDEAKVTIDDKALEAIVVVGPSSPPGAPGAPGMPVNVPPPPQTAPPPGR